MINKTPCELTKSECIALVEKYREWAKAALLSGKPVKSKAIRQSKGKREGKRKGKDLKLSKIEESLIASKVSLEKVLEFIKEKSNESNEGANV